MDVRRLAHEERSDIGSRPVDLTPVRKVRCRRVHALGDEWLRRIDPRGADGQLL